MAQRMKPFSRIERRALLKERHKRWLQLPGHNFGENTWAAIKDIELLLEARPKIKRGTRATWLGWSEVMSGPDEQHQAIRRRPIAAGSRGKVGLIPGRSKKRRQGFRPPDGHVPSL